MVPISILLFYFVPFKMIIDFPFGYYNSQKNEQCFISNCNPIGRSHADLITI